MLFPDSWEAGDATPWWLRVGVWTCLACMWVALAIVLPMMGLVIAFSGGGVDEVSGLLLFMLLWVSFWGPLVRAQHRVSRKPSARNVGAVRWRMELLMIGGAILLVFGSIGFLESGHESAAVVAIVGVTCIVFASGTAWVNQTWRRYGQLRVFDRTVRCAACGYDLRATADAEGAILDRCPECGQPST